MTTPLQGSLGPYRIVESLGKGGMGEVYKAVDTRLDRPVAIKRLNSVHVDRFQREAHAIAALNHPRICTLYDVGPDYLVMEYVEGAPLRGPYPGSDAVALALDICAALESAHARGIIHRDLKPANILLGAAGIKLVDFGLAKLMDAVTADGLGVTETKIGTIVGTPGYMSPEQAEGRPVDERTDIYSFGLVFYEMLTGHPAGRAACLTLEPLQSAPEIAAVIGRCLQGDPAKRFQTFGEIRSALSSIAVQGAEEKDGPSIAVLPFVNLTGDRENEFFSDGLADEIINTLSRTPGLRVIARTSAFAFRKKQQDIRKIASALNVQTVLEGGVRRSANRLRVTAQLIKADDGAHAWSERYDREIDDLFSVQEEIASAIAASLRVKLADRPLPRRKYHPVLPAYETYLRGIHDLFKNTPDSLSRSKQQLLRASEIDGRYADPHLALAQCYVLLGLHGVQPSREVMPLIRAEALQTLDLNQSSSLGHALLGLVAGAFDYDWTEVDRRFALAMADSPVPNLVRWPYANFCLAPRGRFEEAAEQMELWLEQDPLNVAARADMAFFLNHAGLQDRALAAARSALHIDESSWFAHYAMAEIRGSTGEVQEAILAA